MVILTISITIYQIYLPDNSFPMGLALPQKRLLDLIIVYWNIDIYIYIHIHIYIYVFDLFIQGETASHKAAP